MRVAQISTWETACGIAGYTGMLTSALSAAGIESDVIAIDRMAQRYMPLPELKAAIRDLGKRAASADVVHIQHEFAFFSGSFGGLVSIQLFHQLLAQLQEAGRPVAVTFHTEPTFDASGRVSVRVSRNTVKHLLWRSLVARHFQTSRRTVAIVHTRSSRLALARSGLPSA